MKVNPKIVVFLLLLACLLAFLWISKDKATSTQVRQEGPDSGNLESVKRVGINTKNPFVTGSKRRLWQELSFSMVKAQAEQGDPESQWLLSQMYDYCFPYSLNKSSTLQGIDALVKSKPSQKLGFEQIKRNLVDRCKTVDNGEPIPTEAVTLWLEQSAKQGYFTAQLRNALLKQEDDPDILFSYVNTISKNSAPQDIFEIGALTSLIGPVWEKEDTARAFSSGHYAEYAWQITACRAGLDCSRGSHLMYYACMQGGCGYENYEQYVMNELVSSAGRKDLEETISVIQENFLSH